MSGIYIIINILTNKMYVGSAKNLYRRWITHQSFLNRNVRSNSLLQNAWNKYGAENFEFVIIEYCEINKLEEIEQLWLDAFQSYEKEIGYNILPFAYSSCGYKHTPEARLKLSIRNKTNGIVPPNPKGRKLSEETKARMSVSMKGLKRSMEARQNMRKPKTKEHIQNFIKARTGILHIDEAKRKISEAGRERDKWPHDKGNKCRCRECKDKKNEYYRLKRLEGKK